MSAPRALFDISGHTHTWPLRAYDASPVDDRFVTPIPKERPPKPKVKLHVTLNWFEELKRLAPRWDD